jgi:hypothetical protein
MDGIQRLQTDWSGANSHHHFAIPPRRGDALAPADSGAARFPGTTPSPSHLRPEHQYELKRSNERRKDALRRRLCQ